MRGSGSGLLPANGISLLIPTSFLSLLFPYSSVALLPPVGSLLSWSGQCFLRKEHIQCWTQSAGIRGWANMREGWHIPTPPALASWCLSGSDDILKLRSSCLPDTSQAAVLACASGAVFTLLYTVVYLSHWSSSSCIFMFIFPNAQYLPVIQELHKSDLLNWVWAMISWFWV